jgi:hypothetical protein
MKPAFSHLSSERGEERKEKGKGGAWVVVEW